MDKPSPFRYIQDFLSLKGLTPKNQPASARPARHIALVGDAELDEGNVYECLIESWKFDSRHNW